MRSRRRRPEDHEIILPITPMLDMAFQLLFFFIAIYRPPMVREVQMELSLLPSDAAGSLPKEGAKPGNQPPTEPDPKIALQPYDITVELETRIVQRGDTTATIIERFIIKGILPEVRPGLGVADPAKEEVEAPDLATLTTILSKAHAPAGRTMRERIKLEPTSTGGDLSWGRIVEVMDACYKAGFTNVGLP